jgi:hypothetical protein
LKKFEKVRAKERAKAKERARARAKEIERVLKGEGEGKQKSEGERAMKGYVWEVRGGRKVRVLQGYTTFYLATSLTPLEPAPLYTIPRALQYDVTYPACTSHLDCKVNKWTVIFIVPSSQVQSLSQSFG